MDYIDILSIDELNQLTRRPTTVSSTNGEQNVRENRVRLWEQLLATAHASGLAEKHLTATCNAICFYIRTASVSQTDGTEPLSYSTSTWRETFHVARRAFVAGKNKPALQVLDTLSFLTARLPDRQNATEVVEEAVCEMAEIVYSQQSGQSLKEACIVLYFFLRRLSDFMSAAEVLDRALTNSHLMFERLCASVNISSDVLHRQQHKPWLAFIFSLLLASNVAESKSAALKLLSLLCSDNAKCHNLDAIATTSVAIDVYSASKASALNEITKEVLPAVIVSNAQYYEFLAKQMDTPDAAGTKLELILGILAYGKSRKIVVEADLPNLCNEVSLPLSTTSQFQSSYDGTQILLRHVSPYVRLRVLDLLLASTSPSSTISAYTLESLAEGLPYLHNDTDAFYRGELISIFRRFLTRLQQSYRILERDQLKESVTHRQVYRMFCLQHFNFLKSELSVHRSYSRNILSLEMLSLILEHFWLYSPFNQTDLIESGLLSKLFRLSVNPYDDVRMLSARLVQSIIDISGLHGCLASDLAGVLGLVSQLAARTNRADHADALGRLTPLPLIGHGALTRKDSHHGLSFVALEKLVANIWTHVNALDHFTVNSSFPLHGSLLGVRYMLNSSKSDTHALLPLNLCDKLLLIALKIWTLSQPHLCIDSPEIEVDEAQETDDAGPKDMLAYAWRALRDSNLMMQAILNSFGGMYTVVSKIGDLCLDQLIRLRHRGAFSTVAQTFTMCCQKSRDPDLSGVQSLIPKWFAVALTELHTQAERLTRRSAGLPAMFTALLDPGNPQKFAEGMSKLAQLADEPTLVTRSVIIGENLSLPQVHALNCLKDVMTNSRFRTMTEAFVGPMTQLAAQCMNSKIWAIKNCGLMLLRASVGRLDPNTVIENPHAGLAMQTALHHSMSPIEVAFSLLAKARHPSESSGAVPTGPEQDLGRDERAAELIFAGLDLLGRLHLTKSDKLRARRCVSQHMSSCIWHVRTQVARLLVKITAPDEENDFLTDLFGSFQGCTDSNEYQCRLLVVQGLLDRLQNSAIDYKYPQKFAEGLIRMSDSVWGNPNGHVCALWLQIADQLVMSAWEESFSVKQLISTVREHLDGCPDEELQHHALCKRARAAWRLWFYTHGQSPNLDRLLLEFVDDDDLINHTFQRDQHLQTPLQFERSLTVTMAVLERSKNEARSAVIDAAVRCLNQSPVVGNTINLIPLIASVNFDHSLTRNVLMSQLDLYTTICKVGWQRSTDVRNKLRELSSAYCLHLRFAADDQIEESARWAAVRSLQKWQGMLQFEDMLNDLFGTDGKFQLLLVIYDLLNDDDEDIRIAATDIAASVCNPGKEARGRSRNSCALASRELLLDQLVVKFPGTEMLALACTKKIMNVQALTLSSRPENNILQHCERHAVWRTISELTATANDLFAEEKQNLYVDEVEEIETWMQVFKKAGCQIPDSLYDALLLWVEEGIQSMSRLIIADDTIINRPRNDRDGEKSSSDHNARPATTGASAGFSQDLEILFLRVIIIARMLLKDGSGRKASESVQIQLKQLEHLSRERDLPDFIVKAFTCSF